MSEQLAKLKSKVYHRKAYNADGVICFDSLLALETLLLETSDEYARLWSIQYASNGVYMFNREHKITITEERVKVEEMLNSLINFFSFISLEESFNILQQLKDEN
ncbi:hypothetical protein BDF21DRAFT_497542 [Thamnidium elegans]|nr:hypothetical protein BDF21DRAFT_497542 [Thamnidium elegans]